MSNLISCYLNQEVIGKAGMSDSAFNVYSDGSHHYTVYLGYIKPNSLRPVIVNRQKVTGKFGSEWFFGSITIEEAKIRDKPSPEEVRKKVYEIGNKVAVRKNRFSVKELESRLLEEIAKG